MVSIGMGERLSFQEDWEQLLSTKQELQSLAQEVLRTAHIPQQVDTYTLKLQQFLDEAQHIANRKPKYTYGNPYKCDQFVKHLFAAAWDTSLREVFGAKWLYAYFAPDKHNSITTDTTTFRISGKSLSAWDLLFFTDASGKKCGHVAVFSRQDPVTWALYVYDASVRGGIGERKLYPTELTTTYRTIYYTTPVFAG